MLKFTLDTNCIIDLDEHRPAEGPIRALVTAHEQGRADVALVAISASERQRTGRTLSNFAEFQQRIASLGLGNLGLLKPLAYWDVGFWDYWIEGDAAMLDLEKRIHSVLFPAIKYEWNAFCVANGLDPASMTQTKWQNAKCDVLALWSHVFASRDVFVTSDDRFHKRKPALLGLGAGRIERAADSAALL